MELGSETIAHYCLVFMDSAVEMYFYHRFIFRQSVKSDYFILYSLKVAALSRSVLTVVVKSSEKKHSLFHFLCGSDQIH